MRRLFTAILLTLASGACAELGRGDPLVEVDAAGDVATDTHETASDGTAEVTEDVVDVETVAPISFGDDGVHAVLLDNCTDSGCHSSGAGGFTLNGNLAADYAAVLNEVVPGDALASKLIKKSTNTSSHSGGPVLQAGTAEYELVVAWINAGANP